MSDFRSVYKPSAAAPTFSQRVLFNQAILEPSCRIMRSPLGYWVCVSQGSIEEWICAASFEADLKTPEISHALDICQDKRLVAEALYDWRSMAELETLLLNYTDAMAHILQLQLWDYEYSPSGLNLRREQAVHFARSVASKVSAAAALKEFGI